MQMSEIMILWFIFGAANWLYCVNHVVVKVGLGDFVIGLPMCIICGPVPVLARWMRN